MTTTFLQDDLKTELEKVFDGFKLFNPRGELSNINVFLQHLPVPESKELDNIPIEQLENGLVDDIDEDEPYPFIIVRIINGEYRKVEEPQIINTALVIGTYDHNFNKQGHKDVINVIQKIYEHFAKKPILAKKYILKHPINWTLQEEESYPYYIGGMYLSWETAAIRRESEYA